jgi:DNA-binding NtrC family response regulator
VSSVFRVTATTQPAPSVKPEYAVARMSAATNTPKNRERIVVVDDDSSARSALVTFLTSEGFQVVAAEDGAAGLARVQETAPDALVTDLRMPGMGGLELLHKARELYPELVVVVMTAHADIETAVQAMKEGAEHYVSKPLQLDELLVILRRGLERRRLSH